MKQIFVAIPLLMVSPALAQDVSGTARAADGDSLDFGGIAVRLHGIDAPELSQSCDQNGKSWACGKAAASKLASLVSGRQIDCEERDIDKHGRSVSSCSAGGLDLAGAMVDAGLAVALPDFTDRYVAQEARARGARVGIWAGSFQLPADYRAAHPRSAPRDIRPASTVRPASRPVPSGVYFRNCKEAWAAGAAPLRRGEPGYRPEMAGDGDGIACEPFRRR